ncbi:MAG TPA: hypothetical protein VGM12_10890 [Trebonia sp.]
MRIPNRPARLNRVVLLVTGLILLAAGAFELGTRYGLLHLVPRHQALTFLDGPFPRWAAYVTLAAAIVAGLAALRWLAAQASRRPRTGSWRLSAEPGRGATVLHADSAAQPLAADIETYDGVRAAAAWLTGPRHHPALYLHVRTEYDADLTALRQQIAGHALPRLRRALELDELPSATLITPTQAATRTR